MGQNPSNQRASGSVIDKLMSESVLQQRIVSQSHSLLCNQNISSGKKKKKRKKGKKKKKEKKVVLAEEVNLNFSSRISNIRLH